MSAHFESLAQDAPLVQRVMERLQAGIVEGRLRPGDLLPAEGELARQLGVSRSVVREAIAELTARRLLDLAPGGGARVRGLDPATLSQAMSFLLSGDRAAPDYVLIHEARRALEIEVAGLAARRRTDSDLMALEAVLTEMDAVTAPTDRYIELDVAFHALLARATHNPLFPVLIDSVVDLMRKVRRLGAVVDGSLDNGRAHHRTIFAAVQVGDEAAARSAMAAHLADSERILRCALEGGGT